MKTTVENKSKTIIIAATLVLVIVAGIGFLFWSQKKAQESGEPALLSIEGKDGLGAQAFNKTQNPLANELPETNPFQVNTNPFKAETNPFDRAYQNPFK